MTEQRHDPRAARQPGYRGSLPPRDDALARPWVLIVVAIFILVLVLAFIGFPSKLTPKESLTPSPSTEPSASFTLLPSSSP
jgi:hypothetical protein